MGEEKVSDSEKDNRSIPKSKGLLSTLANLVGSSLLRIQSNSSFKDFMADPELLSAITDCGFEHPSEVQRECTPQAYFDKDIVGHSMSGKGKTAVYVLSTLQQLPPKNGIISVLVLAYNDQQAARIEKELTQLSKFTPSLRVSFFSDEMPVEKHQKALKNTTPHIVVCTPGLTYALVQSGHLKLDGVKFFVIDGCDKLIDPAGEEPCYDVRAISRMASQTKQVTMFFNELPKEWILSVYQRFMQPSVYGLILDKGLCFYDFKLRPDLMRAIIDSRFKRLSEVQRECIPQATLGKDILCKAGAKTGKTTVYVLATLQQLQPEKGTVLALAYDDGQAAEITRKFEHYTKYMPNLRVTCLSDGVPVETNENALKKTIPNIVVGTPGRTLALAKSGHLKLDGVKFFVIDGCDKMIDPAGEDLSRDVQHIFHLTPQSKQVMIFSSTLPTCTRVFCEQFLQKEHYSSTHADPNPSASKKESPLYNALAEVLHDSAELENVYARLLTIYPAPNDPILIINAVNGGFYRKALELRMDSTDMMQEIKQALVSNGGEPMDGKNGCTFHFETATDLDNAKENMMQEIPWAFCHGPITFPELQDTKSWMKWENDESTLGSIIMMSYGPIAINSNKDGWTPRENFNFFHRSR